MSTIHPTAIIEDGAVIGENCYVGPYCRIGANVTMGAGNRLHSQVIIEGYTEMGSGNQFFPFTYIGAPPQDMKFQGEKTYLKIGSNNVFREGVSAHLGTQNGGGLTSVGNDNLIMGYSHIAHDCHIGNANVLANYCGLSGHVEIADHVIIGGQSGVTQFVSIGSYAYIGGATVVDRNIPPYTTGYGNRIVIKGVNVVGLKRKGYSRQSIYAIQEAHRLYYRSDLSPEDALAEIENRFGDRLEVKEFSDFIRGVKGGVKR